jgi:aspartate racemase
MEQMIGIIGGVGPYAGLDVVKKIFDNTVASCDQDHLDLHLINIPSKIGDRTDYLLNGGTNPAYALIQGFDQLVKVGATVVGIPCNTAHAPAIFNVLARHVAKAYPAVLLLNMIEETCSQIIDRYPDGVRIGLLATKGTHAVGLYSSYFRHYAKLELLEPSIEDREIVHGAIYDPGYGIKAVTPVSAKAVAILVDQANKLIDRGAEVIILGCTELPLALHEGLVACPLVDPTLVLARAAIQHAAPEKLRQY